MSFEQLSEALATIVALAYYVARWFRRIERKLDWIIETLTDQRTSKPN